MNRVAQAAILAIVTIVASPSAKALQILPPPPLTRPLSPNPIYSTYPSVLFGVRPDLHAALPGFEVHYLYQVGSKGFAVYLNQRALDCGPPNIRFRVITGPSHGEVQAEWHPFGNHETSSGLPTNSPDGTFWGRNDPRGHCDPNTLQGYWLRYIPAEGFAGTDFASVEIQDGTNIWRGKLWLQVR